MKQILVKLSREVLESVCSFVLFVGFFMLLRWMIQTEIAALQVIAAVLLLCFFLLILVGMVILLVLLLRRNTKRDAAGDDQISAED